MLKRFLLLLTVAVLASFAGSCKCPAAKASVAQIEGTHTLVSTMLLDYVQKDQTIDEAEKTRRRNLVATDNENIQKLKKDLEQ
jgi:hypothetical protein